MTREEAIDFAEFLKNNWLINFADMEKFCDMAIEALKAETVKHGKWITDKDGYPHCSECGFSYGCIECCHDEDTYFCPNCGAKMDRK